MKKKKPNERPIWKTFQKFYFTAPGLPFLCSSLALSLSLSAIPTPHIYLNHESNIQKKGIELKRDEEEPFYFFHSPTDSLTERSAKVGEEMLKFFINFCTSRSQ